MPRKAAATVEAVAPATPTRNKSGLAIKVQKVEELPNRTHGGNTSGKWVDALTPLMEDVGSWYQIATSGTTTSASALASQLRRGLLKTPAGAWEFASRQNEVYAKFLGEDPALAPPLRQYTPRKPASADAKAS